MMFFQSNFSRLTGIARVQAACTIVQLLAASPSTVAGKVIRPCPALPAESACPQTWRDWNGHYLEHGNIEVDP